MCFGGAFGGLPKLKQASKAIFPPSPEAMDTIVWVRGCTSCGFLVVFVFIWCFSLSQVLSLSLRVSFLVVLFSMPVGVLQVISALSLQSCQRRQDITWYYLCCCSSHLVSGSCLCHNQCVPHGVASLNVENMFAVYVQFLQDLFGLLQRTKKQKTRPFLMANYLGPSMLHHLGSLDWRRMTKTLGVKFAKCQAQKCKMNQNASSKMPTCTAFHTAMCNAWHIICLSACPSLFFATLQ